MPKDKPPRKPIDRRQLPKVNIRYRTSEAQSNITEAEIRGTICNPIYAGFGPYPQIVDDETWVRAASRMIREEGAEQYLVNMLYVLRQALGTGAPRSGEE